ncbi:uncharacterized protein LOC142776634 isoform X1 [Rhipicephalus microplus]|uniref:uncharacterized protein LOC142776634 isoform X1 n=1 Tax=Rhipicephalus microplus TaxID=6941 RepID=UPI003F6D99E1
MARANVPRFFLVQFLGLWSLQLLEPSGPRTPFPPSAVRPWPDATPLLPEDDVVGLFWSSNQPVFGESRSAHFVPGRRPYQQASWLSVGHLNTGTSPAHSTHAWDLVKKQAQSNTPFSGSGSTLTMARANVPRFFLVQITHTSEEPTAFHATVTVTQYIHHKPILWPFINRFSCAQPKIGMTCPPKSPPSSTPKHLNGSSKLSHHNYHYIVSLCNTHSLM